MAEKVIEKVVEKPVYHDKYEILNAQVRVCKERNDELRRCCACSGYLRTSTIIPSVTQLPTADSLTPKISPLLRLDSLRSLQLQGGVVALLVSFVAFLVAQKTGLII